MTHERRHAIHDTLFLLPTTRSRFDAALTRSGLQGAGDGLLCLSCGVVRSLEAYLVSWAVFGASA